MACVAAIGAAGPAHAQSPTQYWHQQWQQQQRAPQPSFDGDDWFGGRGRFGRSVSGYADWSDDGGHQRSRPTGPMPQVHMNNPTFYEYRPDTLKTVTFDKLCQVEVASNAQPARSRRQMRTVRRLSRQPTRPLRHPRRRHSRRSRRPAPPRSPSACASCRRSATR